MSRVFTCTLGHMYMSTYSYRCVQCMYVKDTLYSEKLPKCSALALNIVQATSSSARVSKDTLGPKVGLTWPHVVTPCHTPHYFWLALSDSLGLPPPYEEQQ